MSLFAGISSLCFLAATPAYAAEFRVEVGSATVAPGSEVLASVYMDTQDESINAVGGTFVVPALFEVVSVSDGGSVVPMWIEAPKPVSTITFSGITPGGYRGERGLLFSVVLRAKEEGRATLALSDLQALKNDGKGTSATVASVPGTISVSRSAEPLPPIATTDTTPPEPFTIQIVQTTDAFDGKKVLVFAAQDKGSGMSHYEVCEGLFASCATGESAYVLKRQNADVLFTVRAVDNAGNTRTARLFTSAAIVRYALYAILAILVSVGLWFFFRRRRD